MHQNPAQDHRRRWQSAVQRRPHARWRIEARQIERLKEMGAWVTKHGASIYGTRGGPFKPASWGVSTRADNRITLFVMVWPADGRLILPAIPAKITGAATISGTKVEIETAADGGVVVIAPPASERDPIATAVILTLDGPAMAIPAR